MKPPEMLPPRNDSIPNQYHTRITTKQYPSLPQLLEKLHTGHIPFIDDTHF